VIETKTDANKNELSKIKKKIKAPMFAMLSLFAYDAWAYEELHDYGPDVYFGGMNSSPAVKISADGKVLATYTQDANRIISLAIHKPNGQVETVLAPSGTYTLAVRGMSADGAVIVGTAMDQAGWDIQAFKYVNGQLKYLGVTGLPSHAVGVSADGSVIVGNTFNAQGVSQGFKYTDSGGMEDIGISGGLRSEISGVSANGDVIIGRATDANFNNFAFKYTDSDGAQSLGVLPGMYSSEARAVSADGAVIVGTNNVSISSNDQRAFKYTDSGGMQPIHALGTTSWAYYVSANGVVTVGGWGDGTQTHAFKHTDDQGMVDLGNFGGTRSDAGGVSADGSIIVGSSTTAGDSQTLAFRYTDETGMVALSSLGGSTSVANGISADGKIITGYSETITGEQHVVLWKEKTPDKITLLDQTNTLKTLSDAASRGWNVLDMRSAQLDALIQQDCQLTTASYCIGAGSSYTNSRSARASVANLVLGKQLSSQWRIGANLNQGLDASLPAGYKASNHMPGVGVFAQFNARKDGLGWRARAGVAYQQSKVTITRDQLAFTEAGSGRADIKGKAASVEGSYRFALSDDIVAEPYAALRYSKVSRSAYSEANDIEFAASYAAMGREATSIDAGLRVSKQLNDKVSLALDLGLNADVAVDNRDFQVAMDYVGGFNRGSGGDDRTRVHLGAQGRYALSADSGINAGISWSQQAYGNNATAAQLMYVRQF
jgi:probable HAF family extracellular repeat protein